MNSSLSSALECAAAVLVAVMAGCAASDGTQELEQGRAAYEVRDLKKAEKCFEKSLEAAPDDVDRLVWLARVKLELGDLSAVRTHVTKAQAFSTDADVRLLAAQIDWHVKDYKSAAAGFAAIGGDRKLEPSVRAQGEVGLGIVEMAQSHIHLARVAFLEAIRLDPRNAAAWYHLGLLYRDSFGYLEAALDQFEYFVRLSTEASPRVQKVQRTHIPALKEQILRDVTERPGVGKRNSDACSSAIVRAEAAWKKGQYKPARQAYQEAIAADPLSYPAALGLAKAWERTDATKEGQKKAYESYRLACKLRPSATSTYLTAGALAMRLGLDAQALQIYSRAVAASPTSREALDGLIRALRRSKGTAADARAYQLYRDALSVRKK